jgi:uncharacterized protein (DUF1499 family)
MKRLAALGLTLSLLAAVTLLAASFGYRWGMLPLRVALQQLLRWGAYLGIAGTVVSLLALALGRKRAGPVATAVAGLAIGLVATVPPVMQRYYQTQSDTGRTPPIHDISTDTEDPPLFVDVLPLRANAPNTSEYEGERIAKLQRAAYPDLGPTTLDLPPEQAFDRALAAVEAMGWETVSANREAGRIEATDTTFWFGFKDDVVIRLRPEGSGTKVDVRSLSRVGGGDVGTNARRIRAYLEKLKA